ncbi:MAG: UDP-N-acetylglucosamine 2-epimerase, partial [Rhodothermia bacterium]
AAVENLRLEGIVDGVIRTGDVMFDLALSIRGLIASRSSDVLEKTGVQPQGFALVTMHRAENTDDAARWDGIVEGLGRLGAAGLPVVWLVHPRVADKVKGLKMHGVHLLGPQPYLETQILLEAARVVITDSGGLQKEAAFHKRPCVTVRTETEWVELLEAGVNRLVEATPEGIQSAALSAAWPESGLPKGLYGDGATSHRIAREVRRFLDDETRSLSGTEQSRAAKG